MKRILMKIKLKNITHMGEETITPFSLTTGITVLIVTASLTPLLSLEFIRINRMI